MHLRGYLQAYEIEDENQKGPQGFFHDCVGDYLKPKCVLMGLLVGAALSRINLVLFLFSCKELFVTQVDFINA